MKVYNIRKLNLAVFVIVLFLFKAISAQDWFEGISRDEYMEYLQGEKLDQFALSCFSKSESGELVHLSVHTQGDELIGTTWILNLRIDQKLRYENEVQVFVTRTYDSNIFADLFDYSASDELGYEENYFGPFPLKNSDSVKLKLDLNSNPLGTTVLSSFHGLGKNTFHNCHLRDDFWFKVLYSAPSGNQYVVDYLIDEIIGYYSVNKRVDEKALDFASIFDKHSSYSSPLKALQRLKSKLRDQGDKEDSIVSSKLFRLFIEGFFYDQIRKETNSDLELEEISTYLLRDNWIIIDSASEMLKSWNRLAELGNSVHGKGTLITRDIEVILGSQ